MKKMPTEKKRTPKEHFAAAKIRTHGFCLLSLVVLLTLDHDFLHIVCLYNLIQEIMLVKMENT